MASRNSVRAMASPAIITTLKTTKNEVGIEDVGEWLACAAQHTQVHTIDISAKKVTDETTMLLSALVMQFVHLRTLNLGFNKITDLGARSFADTMPLFQGSLTHLDMSGNKLTCHSAGHVAKAFFSYNAKPGEGTDDASRREACRGRTLDLSFNNLEDAGVASVAAALVDRTEARLKLRDVRCTNTGLQALLAFKESLADVDLSLNPISVNGITTLCREVSGTTNWRSVALSSLTAIEPGGFWAGDVGGRIAHLLAGCIKSTPSLESVVFSGNHIGDLGGKVVMEAIQETEPHTLKRLDLGENGLGIHSANGLNFVLRKAVTFTKGMGCSGLRCLQLQGNKLNDECIAVLADGIARSTSLQRLFLARNQIRNQGAKDLAASIERQMVHRGPKGCRPPCLLELDLTDNPIGDEGAEAISRTATACMMTFQDAKEFKVPWGLERLHLGATAITHRGTAALCSAVASRAALADAAAHFIIRAEDSDLRHLRRRHVQMPSSLLVLGLHELKEEAAAAMREEAQRCIARHWPRGPFEDADDDESEEEAVAEKEKKEEEKKVETIQEQEAVEEKTEQKPEEKKEEQAEPKKEDKAELKETAQEKDAAKEKENDEEQAKTEVAKPEGEKPEGGQAGEETTAPPAPAKGKGKATPPPLPPGKGQSKGGKGPPLPPGKGQSKGGKGPPLPPAKGNGKAAPPLPPGKGGGKSAPPLPPAKGGGKGGPPPPPGGGKGKGPPAKGGAKGSASSGSAAASAAAAPKKLGDSPFGRKIHWVQPLYDVDNSIFGELGERNDLFDPSLLKAMLSSDSQKRPANPSAGSGRKSLARKPTGISLLDANRAQNMAIVLSKLKVSSEELCVSLDELDFSDPRLNLDDVELLCTVLPTNEESKKLLEYRTRVEELRDIERKVIPLCILPRCSARLKMMRFALSHVGTASNIINRCKVLRSAAEEVRSSGAFREVLSVALRTGNFINHGVEEAREGTVRGFSMESLASLSSFKTGAISMLHFLCLSMRQSDSSFFEKLSGSLAHVTEASREKVSLLQVAMDAFKRDLDFLKREIQQLDGTTERAVRMGVLMAEAEKESEEMTVLFEEATKECSATQKYFGVSEKAKTPQPPEQFFTYISTFMDGLSVSWADIEKNPNKWEQFGPKRFTVQRRSSLPAGDLSQVAEEAKAEVKPQPRSRARGNTDPGTDSDPPAPRPKPKAKGPVMAPPRRLQSSLNFSSSSACSSAKGSGSDE